MFKHILLTALSAVVFVETWTIDANGQSTWCPPGSTPVPITGPGGMGSGNMCRCPDGSYANINGCGPQPQQSPQPQRYPRPPYNPPQQQQVAAALEAFSSVGHNSVMFQLPQFQPGSQGQYAAQLQQVVKDNSTEEIDKWIPYLNKATESHDAADESMLKKTAAEIRQWASETANNAAETFRRLTASKPTAQPPASDSEWLKNLPTVQESIKSPPQETATKSEPPPGTDFNPDSPMTGFDQQTIVTHPQTGLSESAINWCKAHTPWLCR